MKFILEINITSDLKFAAMQAPLGALGGLPFNF